MPPDIQPQQSLRPSKSIRHANVAGSRVILDLRLQSYHVLDSLATSMWEILTGEADRATTLDQLSERYRVSRERIEGDLGAFADRCVSNQFLVRIKTEVPVDGGLDTKPSHHLNPARPTVLLALQSMVVTAWHMARHGFTATYLHYGQLPRGTGAAEADRSLRIFSQAENFFLAARGSDDCLARSLSLYHFLNRVNVRADHVIGVCRFPFRAHAWVEAGGKVALQRSVADYTPLARL